MVYMSDSKKLKTQFKVEKHYTSGGLLKFTQKLIQTFQAGYIKMVKWMQKYIKSQFFCEL